MGTILRAARVLKSLVHPPKSAITRHLLQTYCTGKGLEIGPGAAPYGDPRRTVFVDRFRMSVPHGTRRLQADAANLPCADACVHYLLSSHCLEHCPNTLATLTEWRRVLEPGGFLVLILPHGDRTFDRERAKTPLEHHLREFEAGADPLDPEHLEDFLTHTVDQHDHAWLDDARHADGTWNHRWLVEHGHVHYHVWTQDELVTLLHHLDFAIHAVLEELPERPDSFLVIGRKRSGPR